jgi:hypothetical protein
MHYTNFWLSGGDNGGSHSVTYSFSPAFAAAQTSLSLVMNPGITSVGIHHYETRPHPNGPNKDFNFGWNYIGGYPPSIDDPNLTSVTAQIWVGQGGQAGQATLNVWFFD